MSTNARDVVNQIAYQLGLEPPGTYRPGLIEHQRRRQLGRTTNIVIWALRDVLYGAPIQFMAPTFEGAAEMVYQAREYARQLGLDTSLILRPVPYGVETNPRWWPPGTKVHKDHPLNYSGGAIREPQTSVLSGLDGFVVDCPWCKRTIRDPLPPDLAYHERASVDVECRECGGWAEIYVHRVRVTLKAWRKDNPEDVGGMNEDD